MKLFIQIPCFNEEESLPITLKDLPRQIPGVEEIEILVIDDGSTDRTAEIARSLGVRHIIRFTSHKGLAKAFMAGLDACLRLGADIIVNTDADNQYRGEDIARLIKPVMEGKADMVVGDRNIEAIRHFSPFKKRLQQIGSWVVRQVSGTDIQDTTSGFRAFSREAALRINVISEFTYTLETIIQAGKKNISLEHIQVGTNPKLRESRLITNIGDYVTRSIANIIRIYTMYSPLKIFFLIGSFIFFLGFLISLRFLYFYFCDPVGSHIQSLILSAVLLILGFQIVMIGLLADIISANRRLIEDALYRIRKMELSSGRPEKEDSGRKDA